MLFTAILTGLLPSFAVIGAGGLVRRRLSEPAWQGLDKINYELLFPALLFTAAASRPIDLSRVAVIGPSVWAIMTLGLGLAWFARRHGPSRFLDFAGAWQTAWRFNTAMGFVAVAAVPGVDAPLMAVTVGLAIPVANLFAVSALSRGHALTLAGTLRRVATNPYLLSSLAGVLVGISGIALPPLLTAPLSLMAQAAVPLALLSIGATMDWSALGRLNTFSAILVAVKLIALPLAALITCLVLGADPMVRSVLVLFAALPSATAAHVLAAGFGADRVLTATIVAQGTLLSTVTLPLWLLASLSL